MFSVSCEQLLYNEEGKVELEVTSSHDSCNASISLLEVSNITVKYDAIDCFCDNVTFKVSISTIMRL